jgi:methionyl aminopeptidase
MIPAMNSASFSKMVTAGSLLSEIFEIARSKVCVGATTLELDAFFEKELTARCLISGSKGYMGYRFVTCISLNDEVVHGMPSGTKVIKPGDVVKIDVCASYHGFFADMTRTFLVAPVDPEVQRFINVAQNALDLGIGAACVGNRISDISSAIQKEVERNGFGVVRDFAGHGIGRAMHEEPEILNYGLPGRGPLIKAGMGLALEPMITMKGYRVAIANDGWTVRTVDGSLAAHVEDTIIVTDNGPVIVTRPGRG